MQRIYWEARLKDGRWFTSQQCQWSDLPEYQILVIRWYDAAKKQKGIHFGDSYYGEPGTWKACGEVSDEEFQQAMDEARARSWPSGSI